MTRPGLALTLGALLGLGVGAGAASWWSAHRMAPWSRPLVQPAEATDSQPPVVAPIAQSLEPAPRPLYDGRPNPDPDLEQYLTHLEQRARAAHRLRASDVVAGATSILRRRPRWGEAATHERLIRFLRRMDDLGRQLGEPASAALPATIDELAAAITTEPDHDARQALITAYGAALTSLGPEEQRRAAERLDRIVRRPASAEATALGDLMDQIAREQNAEVKAELVAEYMSRVFPGDGGAP